MIRCLVNLDLDKPALRHTNIVLNQANKDSVELNIRVYKDTEEVVYPQFTRAELVFMKPDKSNVVDDADITADRITYTLRPEIFDVTGRVIGYVNLYSGETITASLHYSFIIISDLLNAGAISNTYVSAIERIRAQVEAIRKEAQDILAGLESEAFATIEFVNNAVADMATTQDVEDAVSAIPWENIKNTPESLAGYGITDALPLTGGELGGPLIVNGYLTARNDTTPIASTDPSYPLNIETANGSAAFIIFHRPGQYGVNLGLDTDNVLKVGGLSMGEVAYPIYHAGNLIIESGAFTPIFVGPEGAEYITYDVITGNYTRIYDLVFINIYLATTIKPTMPAETLWVGHLPFGSHRDTALSLSLLAGWVNKPSTAHIHNNSAGIVFVGDNGNFLVGSDMGASGVTTSILISGCYNVAE